VCTSECPSISETTFVGHCFNERVANVWRKSCQPPILIPRPCTTGRTYRFRTLPGLSGVPARDRNTHSPLRTSQKIQSQLLICRVTRHFGRRRYIRSAMRCFLHFRPATAAKYINAEKMAEITTSPKILKRGSLRNEKGTSTPKLKVTKPNLPRFRAGAWRVALRGFATISLFRQRQEGASRISILLSCRVDCSILFSSGTRIHLSILWRRNFDGVGLVRRSPNLH